MNSKHLSHIPYQFYYRCDSAIIELMFLIQFVNSSDRIALVHTSGYTGR